MLIDHIEKGACYTVACTPTPIEEASTSGAVVVDENEKIIKFVEKLASPLTVPTDPAKSPTSMGIYIFDTVYLRELLEEDDRNGDSSHDFGEGIIPEITGASMTYAHPFPLSRVQSDLNIESYRRDVGMLEAYWRANLDLVSIASELDMYDQNWPIHTHMKSLPPTKFVQDRSGSHGMILDPLASGGYIISGSVVVQSVLLPRVWVNPSCNIDSAVLLSDV